MSSFVIPDGSTGIGNDPVGAGPRPGSGGPRALEGPLAGVGPPPTGPTFGVNTTGGSGETGRKSPPPPDPSPPCPWNTFGTSLPHMILDFGFGRSGVFGFGVGGFGGTNLTPTTFPFECFAFRAARRAARAAC